jgi:hypothetical protein
VRPFISLLAALAAFPSTGCFPISCSPDAGSEPDDSPEPCGASLHSSLPGDGEADFYYRASLEFVLEEEEPGDPRVELTGPTGLVAGEVTLAEDRETVFFTPSEPLAPETTYTAVLSTCAGDFEVTFATSNLGWPLEVDLTGRTYRVNLAEGRVIEPEGVGDLIVVTLDPVPLLVEVERADEVLELMGAASEGHGSEQALCSPTIPFPPADFSEAPYFEVDPLLLELEMDGVGMVTVHDFEMSGSFAADGASFGGGTIAGELDARELEFILKEIKDPEEICELLASFGAGCVPCTSDGEPYCMRLRIDQIPGRQVELDLVEVTDPSANPDCQ